MQLPNLLNWSFIIKITSNMKTLILSFFSLIWLSQVGAQDLTGTQQGKFISVVGSAEMMVTPDIIQLEITLHEYSKSKIKKSLKKVEADFYDTLFKHGLSKEDITFKNSKFYWYHWWHYYRSNTYSNKKYLVTLNSDIDILKLLQDLDRDGIRSLSIAQASNSKIQELRKQVKIQAIQAAKEKASYLLESIDEKVGAVISIEERQEKNNLYWRGQSQLVSNVAVNYQSSGNEIDNVSTIKLRYEIHAKFEIK